MEKKNAPLGDFKAKVYLEDSDEPLLFVIEVGLTEKRDSLIILWKS